jgi:hypothetical protein
LDLLMAAGLTEEDARSSLRTVRELATSGRAYKAYGEAFGHDAARAAAVILRGRP